MTDLLQRQASDPARSVFVSANAGTGKTKVLIERVLRLLLSEEVPQTILCVTFTNAAAAEIEERLHRKLASWAVMEQQALMHEIKEMTGALPAQQMIDVARRLFALVIDNDEGPRIETTHSFCQSLLSRFPVEAGLPPQFKLITESQKETFISASFAACFHAPERQMKQAVSYLVSQTAHQNLLDHVKDFINHRRLSDAAITMPLGFLPAFEAAMAALHPHAARDKDDAQRLINAAIADQIMACDGRLLITARGEKFEKFGRWLALDDADKPDQLEMISGEFLTTAKGTVRKSFTTKAIRDAYPDAEDQAQKIGSLLHQWQSEKTAIETIAKSRALYVMGRAAALDYARAKWQAGVLDYDDLIIKSHSLLSQSQSMAWVRWKLDFGIHHMLVDEAQDTNPLQWDLLSALVDEFFTSEADDKTQRTIFSVGDFKQSIYSFQGADPQVFLDKGHAFEQEARAGGRAFQDVKLTKSFRSSKAILDYVNHVMRLDDIEGLGGHYYDHEAAFVEKPGIVELWPLTTADKEPPELPYFDVPDFVTAEEAGDYGADAKQAELVARHIKDLLSGSLFEKTGKIYQPRDILILVSKRDRFFSLLRGALQRQAIPVAGADRIHLDRQIEVHDMLALGDVCLLPEDDLQLASLLKSPLFNFSEDDVMGLAMGRPQGQSLIAALKGKAGGDDIYGKAVKQLEHYVSLSVALTPAAFFETILAQEGKQAFYKRLGQAVDESLNAFILQAYDFEAEGGIGLGQFLKTHRKMGGEVKRDFGNALENQVRIMTIHGSKGLEAPVVYLPDTVKGLSKAHSLYKGKDALYWPHDSKFMPQAIADLKQEEIDVRIAEHQRLLYVALTRASECLFLGGYQKKQKSTEGTSWYELLEKGFQSLDQTAQPDDGYLYHHKGTKEQVPSLPDTQDHILTCDAVPSSYPWAFTPAPKEAEPVRPLVPSQARAPETPESVTDDGAMTARALGSFAHKLLEDLTYVRPEDRPFVADRLMTQANDAAPTLSKELLQKQADLVLTLMANPEFAPLFSDTALVEFDISGVVGHRAVVGQIDRLVVGKDYLWLVDFKSGKAHGDHVPDAYVLQMALYRALLRDIYPDKDVIAELIWLRDASTTRLGADVLDNALIAAGLAQA